MKFVSHIEKSVLKLDTINQKIWEKGFNIDTLSTLTTLTKEVYNGTTVFERIPQAQQSGLSRGSAFLCSAAIICRGCPRTESENREIYSTEDLIGDGRIQEVYSPYRFYPSLFLGQITLLLAPLLQPGEVFAVPEEGVLFDRFYFPMPPFGRTDPLYIV